MDKLAQEFHFGRMVKKYLGNALQHQLASLIGEFMIILLLSLFCSSNSWN
jgi:hypothetical protein